MKNIYLIVGKSGSGKSTIVHELCNKYNYKEVQSYTERPKRYEDEVGHIFITKEEFDRLENLCAYTVFNGNRYGVPSSMIDECDLYVIDTYGVKYMKEHYHGNKHIKVIGIYCSDNILEDTTIRKNRMLNRGDSLDDTMTRLKNDEEAFKDLSEFIDYRVFNEDIYQATDIVKKIIDECEV